MAKGERDELASDGLEELKGGWKLYKHDKLEIIDRIFPNNKMAKGERDELASDGLEDFVLVTIISSYHHIT